MVLWWNAGLQTHTYILTRSHTHLLINWVPKPISVGATECELCLRLYTQAVCFRWSSGYLCFKAEGETQKWLTQTDAGREKTIKRLYFSKQKQFNPLSKARDFFSELLQGLVTITDSIPIHKGPTTKTQSGANALRQKLAYRPDFLHYFTGSR